MSIVRNKDLTPAEQIEALGYAVQVLTQTVLDIAHVVQSSNAIGYQRIIEPSKKLRATTSFVLGKLAQVYGGTVNGTGDFELREELAAVINKWQARGARPDEVFNVTVPPAGK